MGPVSEKDPRFSRGSLETSTAERLEAIVAAAEKAAAKVIDDAEAQALQHLADARVEAEILHRRRIASVSATTEALIGQVEEIQRRCDRLIDSLEEVRTGLDSEAGNGRRNRRSTDRPHTESAPSERMPSDRPPTEQLPADRPPSRGTHLSAVAPLTGPEPLRSQSHPVRESPAGARLLATQMAVSGSSREEIASRLRNGFEIEDTDAILDAILGPED